jgi:uncharacterized membrane protein YbhN (UPF0104 family)
MPAGAPIYFRPQVDCLNPVRAQFMRAFYRWTGYLLAVLAGVFFVLYVAENWQNLPAARREARGLTGLAGAPVAYIIGFLLTAIAWHLLLRAMGEKLPPVTAIRILLISQFAKYLPGNFGHHVGRVIMARSAGLSSSVAVFSMTLETGGAMLAALGVGSLALAADGTSLFAGALPIAGPGKLILLSLAITALPLVAISLVTRFASGRVRDVLRIDTMKFPNIQSLLVCYFLYVLNYLVVLGPILYFLLGSLTDASGGHFLLMTGIFAITWLIGFVTPGAPGGLGVREAVLVVALDPLFGPGIALSLALGMRVVTTIGDAIGFLAGLALRQWVK